MCCSPDCVALGHSVTMSLALFVGDTAFVALWAQLVSTQGREPCALSGFLEGNCGSTMALLLTAMVIYWESPPEGVRVQACFLYMRVCDI